MVIRRDVGLSLKVTTHEDLFAPFQALGLYILSFADRKETLKTNALPSIFLER